METPQGPLKEYCQSPHPLYIYAAFVVCVVAVSTAAPLIKATPAPPLAIATARMAVSSLIFLIFFAPTALFRNRELVTGLGRRELVASLLAGTFLAAHFASWVASLSYVSVAVSVVLVATNPLFVSVLSWILFRERLTRKVIVGMLVAFAGILVIGTAPQEASDSSLTGQILAIIGAVMAGAYFMAGRQARRQMPLSAYLTVTYTWSAILLVAAALVVGVPLLGYPPTTYLLFVLLALVPQVIGHSLANWCLKYLPATLVSLVVVGEPVGASLIAWKFLSEVPSRNALIGGPLVLAGVLIALVAQTRVSDS